jgi:hypothetical protein
MHSDDADGRSFPLVRIKPDSEFATLKYDAFRFETILRQLKIATK